MRPSLRGTMYTSGVRTTCESADPHCARRLSVNLIRHHADHLSFHRTRRQLEGLDLRRPCSRAVHHRDAAIDTTSRFARRWRGLPSPQLPYARAGNEIDAQRVRSLLQHPAQLARIDTALRQQIRSAAACDQRLQSRKLFIVERPRAFADRRSPSSEECDRAIACADRAIKRLGAQFGRRTRDTVARWRRSSSPARGGLPGSQCAIMPPAACVASRAGSPFSTTRTADAALTQAPRQRQPNHPSTNDDDVPGLHRSIVFNKGTVLPH